MTLSQFRSETIAYRTHIKQGLLDGKFFLPQLFLTSTAAPYDSTLPQLRHCCYRPYHWTTNEKTASHCA